MQRLTFSVLGIALTAGAALGAQGCSDDAPASSAAGACGAPLAPGAVPEAVPEELACTGLYTDIATQAVAPTARGYAPALSFWTDGKEKDRWIQLPDGAVIDAANVDDWKMPVGTKVWKEIRSGSRKIETRFFWKVTGDRWLQAAYLWKEDGSGATRAEGADVTIDGKPYHVPRSSECNDCHRGRKDKLLGFEAISLGQPAATGLTLATLVTEKRIAPAPARTSFTIPEPAFAVLHTNCGITCHNGTATASAFSTGLRLRLGFEEIAAKPPAEWEATKTTVGVAAFMPGWQGETRVKAGLPEESLIVTVMKLRGEGQMPPIATKEVDTQGVAAIEAWIKTLK